MTELLVWEAGRELVQQRGLQEAPVLRGFCKREGHGRYIYVFHLALERYQSCSFLAPSGEGGKRQKSVCVCGCFC